ncbi:MAG: tRNA pseudouridine synthase A, partial [Planctomycetota bacterium]
MPRYRLTLAYDGTAFHGWQKQIDRDGASLRTVQAVLEEALRRVVREEISVRGASRTDAGVHARAQVAAFTTGASIPVERLPQAINARLPDDVQV